MIDTYLNTIKFQCETNLFFPNNCPWLRMKENDIQQNVQELGDLRKERQKEGFRLLPFQLK